jgi:glutamine synthetase
MNGDFRKQIEEYRTEMKNYVKENDATNGLNLKSKEEVKEYVKKHEIDSIRVWFTDTIGFLKSFSITSNELDNALNEGMGFDGSSIEGYSRIQESDMIAMPIPKTTQLIPFKIGGSKAIRMFAKVQTPEGELYPRDPRNILKQNLEKLKKHDLTTMYVGPEAEFFYFKENNSPQVIDEAGYFDLNPTDVGDSLRELTVFALQSMGIEVEYHHHEVAPSQHEIDLKYKEALRMADNLLTYKWLVKEIARQNGVHATFMPKPLAKENGSGMHVHLSLFKDKENKFYNHEDEKHLSELAKKFIAGTLKHASEMCLTTNQWTNSYKRLIPGFEAPVYIAWAERNRSALVRVPVYKPGKEDATRIELRFPDAACNPYLAFAAMLGAGLEGVEKNYELPNSISADLYKMSLEQREELGIKQLPHDLYDAVMSAKDSELMKKVIGNGTLNHLVRTKLEEHFSHKLDITKKELRDYLKL